MCLKFSSPENMNFLLIAQNWSNLSFCKPESKKTLNDFFLNFQTYGVYQLSRDHQLSDSQIVPFTPLSEPQQWENIWLFWFTLDTFIWAAAMRKYGCFDSPFTPLSEPHQWDYMVVLIHPLHLYLSRINEKIWLLFILIFWIQTTLFISAA